MGEQKGDEVPPTDEDMQFAEDLDGDLEDKTGQAGAEPDITVRENDDGSRVIEIDYDKEGGALLWRESATPKVTTAAIAEMRIAETIEAMRIEGVARTASERIGIGCQAAGFASSTEPAYLYSQAATVGHP
ncbi:hypothetical protein KAF44_19135 [Cupriavidus necator]|nr:hypothetical protein KAF44_19135 [Cupriavidus necator]